MAIRAILATCESTRKSTRLAAHNDVNSKDFRDKLALSEAHVPRTWRSTIRVAVAGSVRGKMATGGVFPHAAFGRLIE
jgi:hypothetical protein